MSRGNKSKKKLRTCFYAGRLGCPREKKTKDTHVYTATDGYVAYNRRIKTKTNASYLHRKPSDAPTVPFLSCPSAPGHRK